MTIPIPKPIRSHALRVSARSVTLVVVLVDDGLDILRPGDLRTHIIVCHGVTQSVGARQCPVHPKSLAHPLGDEGREGLGVAGQHLEVQPRLGELELADHEPAVRAAQLVDPGVVELFAEQPLGSQDATTGELGRLVAHLHGTSPPAVALLDADLPGGRHLLHLGDHLAAEDVDGGLALLTHRLDERLHHPRPPAEVVRWTALPEHDDPAAACTDPRLDHGVPERVEQSQQVGGLVDRHRRHHLDACSGQLHEVDLVGVPGERGGRVQHPRDRAGPLQELRAALLVVPGGAHRHQALCPVDPDVVPDRPAGIEPPGCQRRHQEVDAS